MKKYVYNAPKVKLSTQVVDVLDDNEKVVVRFNRVYKNIFYKIVDFIAFKCDGFVQYDSYSPEGTLLYQAIKRLKMVKASDYVITCYNEQNKEYKVTLQTVQTLAPDFLVECEDEKYVVKKTPMDWARVYYNDKEVARWRMKTTEFFKTYVEIEEDSPIQDPAFFICLCQCLFYVGD
jgi:glycerol-3-phosphate cytidylyltransferase-like family protein